MINRQNFFYQPVENNLRIYDDIWKIAIGREDYTTDCLLDYIYFNKYYEIIAIDLSKQQALYVDPKEMQQITFYRKSNSAKFTGSKCKWKKKKKLF